MNRLFVGCLFSNYDKMSKFAKKAKDVKTIIPLNPRQHPKEQLTKRLDILEARKRFFLNEIDEKPQPLYIKPTSYDLYEGKEANKATMQMLTKKPNIKPEEQLSLEVGIVGAPNAGKSTFMNQVVGSFVSATSNKSNTTDNSIVGVHTNYEKRVQLILRDTPGITKRHKYSRYYVTRAWNEIDGCDLIIFMIDGAKVVDNGIKEAIIRLNRLKNQSNESKILKFMEKDQQDQINNLLMEMKQNTEIGQDESLRKVLVINKLDLCFNKKKLRENITELEDLTRFEQVFYISSLTGYGMDQLIEYLYKNSYQCKWKYEDNLKTNQFLCDQIEQIVKSAIFDRFYQEIPFMTTIELTEFRVNNELQGRLVFTLGVEREKQVGIILGEKGRNLNLVRNAIQSNLIKTFQKEFDIKFIVRKRKDNEHELMSMMNEYEIAENMGMEEQPGKTQLVNELKDLKQRRRMISSNLEDYLKS